MKIDEIKKWAGVRDLPLKVKLAFSAAIRAEANGENEKAEKYLNMAVDALPAEKVEP